MAPLSIPGYSTVHPSKTVNSIRPNDPPLRSGKRFSSASLQGPRFIQSGAQRPREVRARLFWEGWFRDTQNGSVPNASTETSTAPISTPELFTARSPTVVNGGCVCCSALLEVVLVYLQMIRLSALPTVAVQASPRFCWVRQLAAANNSSVHRKAPICCLSMACAEKARAGEVRNLS